MRVVETITRGFTNGHSTIAVLFDIEKAFDKVWHAGLIHKMHEMGYSLSLIKLIQSYLRNRKFRVKINETTSTWRSITAGVPQSSLISPLLFNIFIADIPKPEGTDISLYADDLLILTTDRNINFARNITQEAVN